MLHPGHAVAIAALLLLSLTPLSVLSVARAEDPATVSVGIVSGAFNLGDKAFDPNPVLVKAGDTVRWTNHDVALHTVTSGTPSSPDGKFGFDEFGFPDYIPPSQTFEHTFNEEGEYPYFCSLHPFMTATVIVGDERTVPALSISTDKSSYAANETINISGRVKDMTADGGNQVAVQILNPSGLAYRFEPAGLLDDGSFTFPLSVGGPLGISGTYNIHVEYAGHHASTSFYFEAPRSHLAVNAVSQDGARLHMWFSVETFRIGSGSGGISSFTPTGVTLDSGRTYPVTVSDYLDSKFSHWEDGSTNRTRTVMLSENTTITAYYKSGQSIRGFTPLAYAGSDQEPDLNVNAATFDGRALHMWTRIQNVETTTEEGTTTYTVTPRDFNGRYFDHWEDGSTSRTRTLTISEDTTITAYYRTA